MTACNLCAGDFVSLNKDKLRSFHVILRITYRGNVLVNNEKLLWPVAIVKERIFPYTPSEKDVEQFFKDGKCFLDKMDQGERKNYLEKDASLPLGL